jgi:hypothetical protein
LARFDAIPVEAATPLPFAQVAVRNGRLAIEMLVVDDEVATRMASEAPDPARFVIDALGVGARVLDRQQSSAETDLVKAEFERMRAEFTERSKAVADRLDEKVEQVFAPEEGHVSRVFAKHFGDESSAAVQHKVRAVVAELAGQIREDVRRQFTSDSEQNPIVAIQRATLKAMRESAEQQAVLVRAQSEQQATSMRQMTERMEALRLELAALKAEREKLEEVAAEAERGTAKGRTYEESVYEALDAIAHAQGDDCDAVGDLPGVGGRKGDVVVAIEACTGPARGRIVFEAKNSQVPKKRALAELDAAMEARGADYGVFVVPTDEKLPARTPQLREFNGDKLFVVFDPDDDSRLALEVAYSLARARVLMTKGSGDGLDADALRAEVERAVGAMDEVRRVKQQLTHASNGIEQARTILDAMAAGVRAHLAEIGALLDAAGGEDEDGDAGEPGELRFTAPAPAPAP